jgi:hypothetical protein
VSYPLRSSIAVDDACALLEMALTGPTRGDILDHLDGSRRETATTPVARLRAAMREHTFRTSRGTLALQRVVKALDRSTRDEGFHALQSWDYRRIVFPMTSFRCSCSIGSCTSAGRRRPIDRRSPFCWITIFSQSSACSRFAAGTRPTPTPTSIASRRCFVR